MTAIGFRAVRCLWIAGLLLMSAEACFWPLFRHPTNLLVGVHGGESNDLTAQYLPWHEVPRLTLTRHGQLPFWSPWWGAGSPYLGNPQTSVFYPANLLYWVYEPWWLMSWVLIAHHVVAAAGAYGLCRRLGGTAIGAAFASVAYGFSPVLLARTGAGHYAGIGVVAWYPWAFWMYEDFRSGKRWGLPGVVIALSLAFLAGHPQELVYLVLALTATCLCDAGRSLRFEQPSRALKLVLRWLLAGAMTVGLVAAELIPMAVYYSQASREARLAASHEGEPGLANLLQLLHPFALGDPVSYRGPGSHYWETICYFGLVPLTLSILGLISAIRGRLPIWRLAFVGALAFVFSFGALTPVAGLFGTIMSGLPSFRCPGRWLYLTALSVSILSGIGVSAVAEARADRGIRLRRMLPWTVLLLALVGSVTMVAGMIGSAAGGPGSNGRPLPPWEIFTAMIVKPAPCLALASALVCLAAAWSRPRRAALAAALLIPVAVLENAAFANAILTTLSQQTSVLDNHPASTFAKGAPGFRVFCQQAVVSDGQAMEDDLLKVQKYEPVPLDRTLRCLSATLNAGTRPPIAYLMGFVPFELGNASSGLLDLWAIRWVITTAADRPPPDRRAGSTPRSWKSPGQRHRGPGRSSGSRAGSGRIPTLCPAVSSWGKSGWQALADKRLTPWRESTLAGRCCWSATSCPRGADRASLQRCASRTRRIASCWRSKPRIRDTSFWPTPGILAGPRWLTNDPLRCFEPTWHSAPSRCPKLGRIGSSSATIRSG